VVKIEVVGCKSGGIIGDFSESNEEFSSTDDDSFSFENIDYIEASPTDSELVSSKVMEIVIPKVRGIKASNDNPILFYDPIISGTPPNLTPSRESDFFLEVDAFLAVEYEFTSSQFLKSYLDPEGDMLLFEAFLNDDHSSDFKTKSSSPSLNSLLEETHIFDNSLPEFTTFSKVLFDAEYESDSSDDQSCSDEDVLEKSFRNLCLRKMRLIVILRKTFVLSRNCCTITLFRVYRKNLFLQILMLKLNLSLHLLSSLRIVTLLWRKLIYSVLWTPMPPGIMDKDYDSERDILIPKDLPSN
nr:hypothetical protein [Tanacetum cinerariifolium]